MYQRPHPVRITVDPANEQKARELFVAAGFSSFEMERDKDRVTFLFYGVANEDTYRLMTAIPREMYLVQGVIVNRPAPSR